MFLNTCTCISTIFRWWIYLLKPPVVNFNVHVLNADLMSLICPCNSRLVICRIYARNTLNVINKKELYLLQYYMNQNVKSYQLAWSVVKKSTPSSVYVKILIEQLEKIFIIVCKFKGHIVKAFARPHTNITKTLKCVD